jgi:hypothetical protein
MPGTHVTKNGDSRNRHGMSGFPLVPKLCLGTRGKHQSTATAEAGMCELISLFLFSKEVDHVREDRLAGLSA